MLRPLFGISLPWVALLATLALSGLSVARVAVATDLPFKLTRTLGRCLKCKTATSLIDVQFVSPDSAWAIGFLPPGETGSGDSTLLQTRDGGKHWTELANSYQHNGAPLVSFADDREGWMSRVDMPTGETRFAESVDGGRHWRRFPFRDGWLLNIQNLGGGKGVAAYDALDADHLDLIATSDHGRHWSRARMPTGFRPDRMVFSSVRQGVLAGCRNKRLVSIATTDGGLHWTESPIGPPFTDNEAPDSGCDFQIDGLSLLGPAHVWLLANKHSFKTDSSAGGVLVLESVDGGVHWRTSYQEKLKGFASDMTSLAFVDERLGFLTKVNESVANTDSHSDGNALLYTIDGGLTWQQTLVSDAIWGCHAFAHEVRCAAGREGQFEIVTIAAK